MSGDRRNVHSEQVAEHFGVLGNRRRLLTIQYLSLFDTGTAVDVRQVARIIRGVELDRPPREVGTADYESAYNSLIQLHLPKLDDEGIIEYDRDRKTVFVTPRTAVFGFLASFGGVALYMV